MSWRWIFRWEVFAEDSDRIMGTPPAFFCASALICGAAWHLGMRARALKGLVLVSVLSAMLAFRG